MIYVLAALGGALGALARWGDRRGAAALPRRLALVDPAGQPARLPAIGVLLAVLLARFPHSPWLRPFLAVGVLGGFTTYSTFAVDVVRLPAAATRRSPRPTCSRRCWAACSPSSSACSPAARPSGRADTVDAELRAGEGET